MFSEHMRQTDFELPDWRRKIIFFPINSSLKHQENAPWKSIQADLSEISHGVRTEPSLGPYLDPAPPFGDAWSIHLCLAIQITLLKCNPDFIWILNPCLNPELILTQFFVLRLDEPEHWSRAKRRVDEPRVHRRWATFTHQRHISFE